MLLGPNRCWCSETTVAELELVTFRNNRCSQVQVVGGVDLVSLWEAGHHLSKLGCAWAGPGCWGGIVPPAVASGLEPVLPAVAAAALEPVLLALAARSEPVLLGSNGSCQSYTEEDRACSSELRPVQQVHLGMIDAAGVKQLLQVLSRLVSNHCPRSKTGVAEVQISLS